MSSFIDFQSILRDTFRHNFGFYCYYSVIFSKLYAITLGYMGPAYPPGSIPQGGYGPPRGPQPGQPGIVAEKMIYCFSLPFLWSWHCFLLHFLQIFFLMKNIE